MMIMRFKNGNEDNEMSELIIEDVCQYGYPDNIMAMPLISFVFIVVNEGQCQRSNPILSFHNPVYTTHNCVPACKISHSEFRTNIFLITWNQYIKV